MKDGLIVEIGRVNDAACAARGVRIAADGTPVPPLVDILLARIELKDRLGLERAVEMLTSRNARYPGGCRIAAASSRRASAPT